MKQKVFTPIGLSNEKFPQKLKNVCNTILISELFINFFGEFLIFGHFLSYCNFFFQKQTNLAICASVFTLWKNS